MSLPPSLRQVVAVLVALLAGITVTVAATGGFDENGKPKGTVSVTVHPRTAAIADKGAADETPAGVPASLIEAGRAQQDRLAYSDQLPLVTPLAATEQRGCTTQTVVNQSSRRGVAPRLLVAHYTVSRAGSREAIVRLFDTPSFQASSNYVIDRDGSCSYIVPESSKAWAQAGFNSVAVSIEFVAMGDEGGLSPQQVKVGARVFADSAARWNIPIQRGKVSGCTVVAGGLVDHQELGACGGGHHDIEPFSMAPLWNAFHADAAPVTSVDKVTCRKLNWWRAHGRPKGAAEANAVRRRNALAARGVTCTSSGPVKA